MDKLNQQIAESIKRSKPFIIAVEGVDCAFKETNVKALYKHFTEQGKHVYVLSFPRHNEPSCYLIDRFLNGHYQFDLKDKEINRMICKLFSMDRYDTYMQYNDYFHRNDGNTIIIMDRYVKSNMYQIARMYSHIEDDEEFIKACCKESVSVFNFDYETLGIPKEDFTLYLVPTFNASKRVRMQKKEECGIDIIEADEDLQFKTWLLYSNYIQRCRYMHKDADLIWTAIGEEFKSREQIAEEVIKTTDRAYKKFRGETNV